MVTKSSKKNSVLNKMHDHFLHIAPQYRQLRTTDLGPILFITNKLQDLPKVHAADIGCGAGRYSLKFVQHLGEKCHLFCLDNNREMLRHLREHFVKNSITNFTPIRIDSHKIPLQTDSLDCVISFNAIHHFSLPDFLRESSRVLKNNSRLFVYTRLREQNAKTIWGMHFPSFNKKEDRLYELDELKSAFERSEEHTSELQSPVHLVCRLLLEKKKKKIKTKKNKIEKKKDSNTHTTKILQ